MSYLSFRTDDRRFEGARNGLTYEQAGRFVRRLARITKQDVYYRNGIKSTHPSAMPVFSCMPERVCTPTGEDYCPRFLEQEEEEAKAREEVANTEPTETALGHSAAEWLSMAHSGYYCVQAPHPQGGHLYLEIGAPYKRGKKKALLVLELCESRVDIYPLARLIASRKQIREQKMLFEASTIPLEERQHAVRDE